MSCPRPLSHASFKAQYQLFPHFSTHPVVGMWSCSPHPGRQHLLTYCCSYETGSITQTRLVIGIANSRRRKAAFCLVVDPVSMHSQCPLYRVCCQRMCISSYALLLWPTVTFADVHGDSYPNAWRCTYWRRRILLPPWSLGFELHHTVRGRHHTEGVDVHVETPMDMDLQDAGSQTCASCAAGICDVTSSPKTNISTPLCHSYYLELNCRRTLHSGAASMFSRPSSGSPAHLNRMSHSHSGQVCHRLNLPCTCFNAIGRPWWSSIPIIARLTRSIESRFPEEYTSRTYLTGCNVHLFRSHTCVIWFLCSPKGPWLLPTAVAIRLEEWSLSKLERGPLTWSHQAWAPRSKCCSTASSTHPPSSRVRSIGSDVSALAIHVHPNVCRRSQLSQRTCAE